MSSQSLDESFEIDHLILDFQICSSIVRKQLSKKAFLSNFYWHVDMKKYPKGGFSEPQITENLILFRLIGLQHLYVFVLSLSRSLFITSRCFGHSI